MPTMTLEELAEKEYAEAMERDAKDKVLAEERANEDPESEVVLERERLKQMAKEDWADYVPKGRGVTKHI